MYNVEVKPKGGAKIARSAGIFAQVVANADGYTNLKMPSSEIRKVSENCWACIGTVSNEEYKLVNFGKAGRSRWKGIRPTVRGTAMNPVDHPHGGGEGRQGRGLRRAKSMWVSQQVRVKRLVLQRNTQTSSSYLVEKSARHEKASSISHKNPHVLCGFLYA